MTPDPSSVGCEDVSQVEVVSLWTWPKLVPMVLLSTFEALVRSPYVDWTLNLTAHVPKIKKDKPNIVIRVRCPMRIELVFH